MNTAISIIIGLLFLMGYWFMYRPMAIKRKNRLEALQAEEKKRAQEQKEKLSKYSFVVYFRERDGKKTEFESRFIQVLRTFGVTVLFLPEEDLKKIAAANTEPLKENCFAVIGFYWFVDWDKSYHCDYRLITTGSEGKGSILASGYREWHWVDNEYEPRYIAQELFGHILSNTK